jgi:hypothetical protein
MSTDQSGILFEGGGFVEPVSTPGNLAVTLSIPVAGSLLVTWGAYSGAISYKVSIGTRVYSMSAAASGLTGTSLTINNLNPNTIYYVQVVAFLADLSSVSSTILNTTSAGSGPTPTPGVISAPAYIVNSIASLRSATASTLPISSGSYTTVFVLGYYGAGTPGGGMFYYNSAVPSPVDNGGTIIVDSSGRGWYATDQYTMHVARFGAKGDNTTDDSTAIINTYTAAGALNCNSSIDFYGLQYLVTQTIAPPSGTTLRGTLLTFARDGYFLTQNTVITTTSASLSPVVQLGSSGNTSWSGGIRDLVIYRSVPPNPGTIGLYVISTFNSIIEDVAIYGHAQGAYFKDVSGQGGIAWANRLFTGNITDAHLVFDTWFEFRGTHIRLGTVGTGDGACNTYVRITGGIQNSAAGPNTIVMDNFQWNQGLAVNVSHGIEIVNYVAPTGNGMDSEAMVFTNGHIEALTTAFLYSDSTVNKISGFTLDNLSIAIPAGDLFALNPATTLEYFNLINCPKLNFGTITLTPNDPINGLNVVNNNFKVLGAGGITITPAAGSIINWGPNFNESNTKFSAAPALTATGAQGFNSTIAVTGASGTGTVATLTFSAISVPLPPGSTVAISGFTGGASGYNNASATVLASPAPTVTSISYSNTTTAASAGTPTITPSRYVIALSATPLNNATHSFLKGQGISHSGGAIPAGATLTGVYPNGTFPYITLSAQLTGNIAIGDTLTMTGGQINVVSNGAPGGSLTMNWQYGYSVADAKQNPFTIEQSWTPVVQIGGSSVGITYSKQSGKWSYNGQMAKVGVSIQLSNTGGLTGAVTITGLGAVGGPPTAIADAVGGCEVVPVYTANANGLTSPVFMQASQNTLFLFLNGSSGFTQLTQSYLGASLPTSTMKIIGSVDYYWN